ncbi:cation:proton antiporter [Aequorivita echinoideorum]|uniref:Cation:proton antiporter n=1 Tax=Aequorivita echinoideorum TaxID=1549647 RepID=A0ABS5SAW6_9FLAO|nr:cation:proton antiporter [Aequorivita echinoideorum]MBT0609010.1 cation:proton antiporter [Aequorivita echinoideorum]
MDSYIFILIIVGIATFTSTWMPKILQKTGISYSIFYLVAGFILYKLVPQNLPNPIPQDNESLTLHLTELIVIISLMGAGIKIDRAFSFKKWEIPLKLVGITMLLCIAISTILGYYFLGLNIASAVLLGAVLAPTDPVLAADVQVGPPNDSGKSETKFSLTAEAGINDGIAFPFTWLAITVGLVTSGQDGNYIEWFGFDLVYRIITGIIIGFLVGRGIGYLVFNIGDKYEMLSTKNSLLAISVTLISYGFAELIHGYGFIAVFIAAITLRHYEKGHKYHKDMHTFTDQIERLLICVLLIVFGGAVALGVLDALTWQMALFVVVFIFLIRPATGLLALSTVKLKLMQKFAISFFGIRGMGSIFYLAFGISEFEFDSQDELWSIVSFTVLMSIVIHGFTATSMMRNLKKENL